MQILIVEDNPVTASGLSEILRHEGYQVDWSVNLAGARAKLAIMVPDVVLLDYLLGDDDGMLLVDEMQHNPRLCRVPIIIGTAVSDDELVPVRQAGCLILRKPFSPGELVAVLEGLKRKSESEGQVLP